MRASDPKATAGEESVEPPANAPTPARPYGRRPLPAKSDWRRALGVYVAGRSRSLTEDEKRALGHARSEDLAAPPTGASAPTEPAFGVPVPDRLDYHRTASTWRNHLPDPKSGGASRAD